MGMAWNIACPGCGYSAHVYTEHGFSGIEMEAAICPVCDQVVDFPVRIRHREVYERFQRDFALDRDIDGAQLNICPECASQPDRPAGAGPSAT